jgi:putative oxidoreductase
MTTTEDRIDYAALILRGSLGVMFLAHGLLKVFVFTPAGTAGYFESLGLPGVLGYLTILAEIGGGIALIAGIGTRLVSLALVPLMIGATWLGHGDKGWVFSNEGGGWEFPAFWTVTLIVMALLGAGRFSVDGRGSRV